LAGLPLAAGWVERSLILGKYGEGTGRKARAVVNAIDTI
jgi:hypothetical protein